MCAYTYATPAFAEPETRVHPSPAATVADGAATPLARGLPGGAATVRVDAGWDGAANAPVGDATAMVHLFRGISAIGGAEVTTSGALRPQAGAALRLGDVGLSATYRAEGLTEPEGEMELGVDYARALGGASLLGGVTYGQDFDGHERDAEEMLAAIVRTGDRVWIGASERARVSLGTPPAGEAAWDVAAGPHASLDAGPVIVTGFAGVSARRVDGDTTAGVAASLGLTRRF